MEQTVNEATASPEPASADGAGVASVDEVSRIRDIIFGANMRDYERRFTALEQRLMHELSTLRDDMIARFEQSTAAANAEFARLHERVSTEVQQLHARVQNETDSRHAADDDLHDALQKAMEQADQRSSELQTLLEHRASELRNDKTDRHQLGALLRQISETLQMPATDQRG